MMNKKFLLKKQTKTSEDCDKLSKSVSYETLVGGTTTSDSADKQTQSLSKGNAGYRFCKTMRFLYENLVDCLSQTLPVFRLVKILGLAVFLSLSIIGDLWALGSDSGDPYIPDSGDPYVPDSGDPYISTCQDLGKKTCGTNCCYSTDTTGKISFARIDETKTGEIGYEGLKNKGITGDVVIPDWITKIGYMGMAENQITSVVVPESVQTTDESTFWKNNLTSVTIMGKFEYAAGAFEDNPNLQEIVLTDKIGYNGALFANVPENIKIRCLGDEDACQIALEKYIAAPKGNCKDYCLSNPTIIFGCGDKFIKEGAGCVTAENCGNGYTPDSNTKQCVKNSAPAQPTAASCASGGKVLQGKSCVAECGSSFRLNDGECDRIRYTPAEAAQYLKDTDNEIIMTFKVNR